MLVGAGIVLGLLLGGLVAREELRDDPDAPVVASVVKAPEKAPETSKPRAETITDGLGRITRIIGKHPADVLDAYCGAIAPHDPPVPVGIESANPERRDAKLGVFRKPYDRTHDYKIWIRRNPSTREWFAGDGMRPIVPERHPSRR